MISENPTLAEAIGHGINTALAAVHKAGPGIVTAYDSVTNTAFVRPAIKHATYSMSTDERSYRDVGEIPFVPVIFPRAGGKILRLPVVEEDTVLLVFCDTSLAEWRESGSVSEPQDARRHSIGWPVAIPGFFPDTNPPNPVDAAAVALGQAIFGEDGGKQLRVGPTGIELAPAGVTPVSPVALAVPLMTYVTAATAAVTAGGAADTTIVAALNAIQSALAALAAIPANAGAATAVTASGVTVGAAATALGTSATAATAAGTAAGVAAGAVPSILVRSL